MKKTSASLLTRETSPVVRDLTAKIVQTRRRAATTHREAKVVKLELRNARRRAKQAKKLAREARKTLKRLKRELRAALAAAQTAAEKKRKQSKKRAAAVKPTDRKQKRTRARRPVAEDRDAAKVVTESFNVGSVPAQPVVDLSSLSERGGALSPNAGADLPPKVD